MSRTEDVFKHFSDVEGWKHFACEFPNFALNSRNICFELASNGFNSFGHMSTVYSMWLVVLILYNLPP